MFVADLYALMCFQMSISVSCAMLTKLGVKSPRTPRGLICEINAMRALAHCP